MTTKGAKDDIHFSVKLQPPAKALYCLVAKKHKHTHKQQKVQQYGKQQEENMKNPNCFWWR